MDKLQLLLIWSKKRIFLCKQVKATCVYLLDSSLGKLTLLLVVIFFLEDLVREVDNYEPTHVMNNCDYFDAAPRHCVVEFFCNHINRSATVCYIGFLVESVMIFVWCLRVMKEFAFTSMLKWDATALWTIRFWLKGL